MTLSDDQVRAAFPSLTFIRRLKAGGFKTPYLVDDDGQQVVLKIFAEPVDPSSSSGQLRSERELRLLGEFDHPHIAKLAGEAELIEIDGEQYLAYFESFAPHGTLADRALPVDPDDAICWFSQLLSALEYLEDHRVVHRDIKPANVGLGEEDQVVLLDLGIALDLTDDTITEAGRVAPLTRAYAAPEQFSPRRLVSLDHRADQYAVGLVMNELVTGDMMADPADWPTTGALPCVSEIVERMTARTPNQRYRKTRLVREALEGCR